MSKISYKEYIDIAMNSEIDDEVFLSYSIVKKGAGGFDFTVVPDPSKVELTDEEIGLENAMAIANDAARTRRNVQFIKDRIFNRHKPVLVSEGDSWFQLPVIVREIVDQLKPDYAIWSTGAAGDTAKNMVHENPEYMSALRAQKNSVQAFLFSAAGNDIIGEDPKTNESALFKLLQPYNDDVTDILGHINESILNEKLDYLEMSYKTVFANVRSDEAFANLPIIIHGYDYPYPYPWGEDDPRNPFHAKNNEWLGEALDARGFPVSTPAELALRRNIIKHLIDKLYDMFERISGQPEDTKIWVVNCRGAMPDVVDWIDEIHGTSAGFTNVAARFKATLNTALSNVG